MGWSDLMKQCSVYECIRIAREDGLCVEHFKVRHGRPPSVVRKCDEPEKKRKPEFFKRFLQKSGYVTVRVPANFPGAVRMQRGFWWIMEHRMVMQNMIGRPLRMNENVHHKNGIRHDNRPENLELWVTSQPCGQRVKDKLAWAREFLATYGTKAERGAIAVSQQRAETKKAA
ncbi:HNHc domain-containing protein (plasmid) [Rhodovastum atsumiense]|nr:HNHc domain-containing protein [Rhodovastum atsumiense]